MEEKLCCPALPYTELSLIKDVLEIKVIFHKAGCSFKGRIMEDLIIP